MRELEEKVADIIAEALGIERDEVKPSSRLGRDLDADPAAVAEVIGFVETAFDIRVPREDAVSLLTVGDLLAYIKVKQRA